MDSYKQVKTLLVVVIIIGLAIIGLGVYSAFIKNRTPGPYISSTSTAPQPASTPFAFKVSTTKEIFPSGLDLLGAYEVAVPADKQWYDTKITISPTTQIQAGFMRGTQGAINLRIGNITGDFSEPLTGGAYYEFDFWPRPPRNKYEHTLIKPETLKIRSNVNNVYVRIEVRQHRLTASQPSQGANDECGLRLDDYCRTRYGADSSAVLVENSALGWRCESREIGNRRLIKIDMDDACRTQHGPRATAFMRDVKDFESWGCKCQ